MIRSTSEEFFEHSDANQLPELQDAVDELMLKCASIYRMVSEDEHLDALESMWKLADEDPELRQLFRLVHEDPTFAPRLDR